MVRRKKKTVVVVMRARAYRDDTGDSISLGVRLGGLRLVAGDGAEDIKRLAEVAHRGDIGHNFLSKGRDREWDLPFSRSRRAMDERHRLRT